MRLFWPANNLYQEEELERLYGASFLHRTPALIVISRDSLYEEEEEDSDKPIGDHDAKLTELQAPAHVLITPVCDV